MWRRSSLPIIVTALLTIAAITVLGQTKRDGAEKPTFYKDVLPILQGQCQECHRAGGIAPMAFETYEETRRYARIDSCGCGKEDDATVVCGARDWEIFE